MTRRFRIIAVILAVVAAGSIWFTLTLSHDAACSPAPPLPANTRLMHAVVYRCYGSADVLHVEQAAVPIATDGRIIVKVHAASLNPLDTHFLRGKPYIARMVAGVGAPSDSHFGMDFAGTVVAVGKNVTRFKPGDEVYGGRRGALAEYLSVPEDGPIVPKPVNINFEQAAAVPIAAITALQGLRDSGQLRAGQKVLINGASGGVGTFAVQIAKAYGAEVTGVSSTRNLDLLRSLGADHVIDYTQQDYTAQGPHYDLIVDTITNHSLLDNRRALATNGIYVMVGGQNDGQWIGPLILPLKALLVSPFVKQKLIFFIADLNVRDLTALNDLMLAGKVTPVIDRRFPLSETPAAIRYLEQGHARGKVIVNVD